MRNNSWFCYFFAIVTSIILITLIIHISHITTTMNEIQCDFDSDAKGYIFPCPHCSLNVFVYQNEINCHIFRHGFNVVTQQQLHPHTPKDQCDKLALDPNIVGCCKPFRLVNRGGIYFVTICDYI